MHAIAVGDAAAISSLVAASAAAASATLPRLLHQVASDEASMGGVGAVVGLLLLATRAPRPEPAACGIVLEPWQR